MCRESCSTAKSKITEEQRKNITTEQRAKIDNLVEEHNKVANPSAKNPAEWSYPIGSDVVNYCKTHFNHDQRLETCTGWADFGFQAANIDWSIHKYEEFEAAVIGESNQ